MEPQTAVAQRPKVPIASHDEQCLPPSIQGDFFLLTKLTPFRFPNVEFVSPMLHLWWKHRNAQIFSYPVLLTWNHISNKQKLIISILLLFPSTQTHNHVRDLVQNKKLGATNWTALHCDEVPSTKAACSLWGRKGSGWNPGKHNEDCEGRLEFLGFKRGVLPRPIHKRIMAPCSRGYNKEGKNCPHASTSN